jgi:hypothetical protein
MKSKLSRVRSQIFRIKSRGDNFLPIIPDSIIYRNIYPCYQCVADVTQNVTLSLIPSCVCRRISVYYLLIQCTGAF